MSRRANKVDQQQIDYSSYSTTYDQSRRLGRRNAYLELIRFRSLKRALRPVPRDARMVDVGCGTGRGLAYLAEAGYTHLCGLDFTAAMLERAAENLSAECPTQPIPLLRGDAFSLPFSDARFDAVCSFNFLHMFRLDLQQQLIREMARVCRSGGSVIVELESLHKGLFLSRYFEQQRHRKTTKFNSVWDIPRLFEPSRFTDVQIVGSVLPKAYLLLERVPQVGAVVESAAFLPGVKWLASRVFVRARVLPG